MQEVQRTGRLEREKSVGSSTSSTLQDSTMIIVVWLISQLTSEIYANFHGHPYRCLQFTVFNKKLLSSYFAVLSRDSMFIDANDIRCRIERVISKETSNYDPQVDRILIPEIISYEERFVQKHLCFRQLSERIHVRHFDSLQMIGLYLQLVPLVVSISTISINGHCMKNNRMIYLSILND